MFVRFENWFYRRPGFVVGVTESIMLLGLSRAGGSVLTVCIFFNTLAATVKAWLKALVATKDRLICTLNFGGTSPNGRISFI